MTELVVVKYGGHAMKEPEVFAQGVKTLSDMGNRVVVVHGGGPQISKMLDRVGIESRFHQGLRVTTPETMEIVRMVLLSIGKDLVRHLNATGASAVGLSGEDGRMMTAVPVSHDIGLVGDAGEVNPALVEKLLADGHVPVVSTIAPDAHGVPHNLNADTAAAALAVALRATKLIILTDVPGLFSAWPDPRSLIPSIRTHELEELMPKLAPGILPKVEACVRAVRGGVPAARVVGDLAHEGTTVLL
ncbi:MAG TPA: acetylglutamate kinase [Candidatus Limnocylindrales bacterium]|nr:acetylglutamate kinase [Candidatus Limnocylindrales bacterium]